jgi:hypothetical protein
MNLTNIDPDAGWEPSPAYKQGGEDFLKCKSISENRYPKGSPDYLDWEAGWCDAEGYDCYLTERPL